MSFKDQELYYPPPPNTPHPSDVQAQQHSDAQLAQDLQTKYDAEHSATSQSKSHHNDTQLPGYQAQPTSYEQEAAQQASLQQTSQQEKQHYVPQQQPYYNQNFSAGAAPDYSETSHPQEYNPPLPPRRAQSPGYNDSSSFDYTRDPHKLVAYLIPFPKPRLANIDPTTIPDRFLIYTPPPPPLLAPADGAKESRAHKLQRKWQEEVKSAKLSDAKVTSWKGAKGRATKGISYAMSWVKSSNLEFLNRVPDAPGSSSSDDKHADDGVTEDSTTHRTVGLTEMLLIYPATMHSTPEQIRASFVDTMLRTKSQAQKDAVLATGLLPIAFAVDVMATLIWPFGGLAEIDAVWAYSSIRGAKTARSVSKRLNSTADNGDASHTDLSQKLALNFVPSERLEVLRRYLAAECHVRDAGMFAREAGLSPTETDVLKAIGWSASGETRNWEDEQWEGMEVKEDLRQVMGKAAKEWVKWGKLFAKEPEKALKK